MSDRTRPHLAVALALLLAGLALAGAVIFAVIHTAHRDGGLW